MGAADMVRKAILLCIIAAILGIFAYSAWINLN
jgi:hypothetical protein